MSNRGTQLDIIMRGNGHVVSYDSDFIFQYSNGANTIRLISPDIGLGYVVELNIKRSDGLSGVPIGMRYEGVADVELPVEQDGTRTIGQNNKSAEGQKATRCHIWAAELSEWHLYKSGTLLIAVSTLNMYGQRQQSDAIQVTVNTSLSSDYTPVDSTSVTQINTTIAGLSSLINDKLDDIDKSVKSVSYVNVQTDSNYQKLKIVTADNSVKYVDIGAGQPFVSASFTADAQGKNIMRLTRANGTLVNVYVANLDKAITNAASALNIANTAKSNADSAISVANAASNTANAAKTSVNEAKTAANEAKTIATNAVNKSDTAVRAAESAVNKATDAVNTAKNAESIANASADTARKAVVSANSAKEVSFTANTNSNNALEIVGKTNEQIKLLTSAQPSVIQTGDDKVRVRLDEAFTDGVAHKKFVFENLKGIKGDTGDSGKNGTSIWAAVNCSEVRSGRKYINGVISVTQINDADVAPQIGDLFIVCSTMLDMVKPDKGNVYQIAQVEYIDGRCNVKSVSVAANEELKPLVALKGQQGEQGEQGQSGVNGQDGKNGAGIWCVENCERYNSYITGDVRLYSSVVPQSGDLFIVGSIYDSGNDIPHDTSGINVGDVYSIAFVRKNESENVCRVNSYNNMQSLFSLVGPQGESGSVGIASVKAESVLGGIKFVFVLSDGRTIETETLEQSVGTVRYDKYLGLSADEKRIARENIGAAAEGSGGGGSALNTDCGVGDYRAYPFSQNIMKPFGSKYRIARIKLPVSTNAYPETTSITVTLAGLASNGSSIQENSQLIRWGGEVYDVAQIQFSIIDAQVKLAKVISSNRLYEGANLIDKNLPNIESPAVYYKVTQEQSDKILEVYTSAYYGQTNDDDQITQAVTYSNQFISVSVANGEIMSPANSTEQEEQSDLVKIEVQHPMYVTEKADGTGYEAVIGSKNEQPYRQVDLVVGGNIIKKNISGNNSAYFGNVWGPSNHYYSGWTEGQSGSLTIPNSDGRAYYLLRSVKIDLSLLESEDEAAAIAAAVVEIGIIHRTDMQMGEEFGGYFMSTEVALSDGEVINVDANGLVTLRNAKDNYLYMVAYQKIS